MRNPNQNLELGGDPTQGVNSLIDYLMASDYLAKEEIAFLD